MDIVIIDNGVLGEPQGIVPDFSASQTAEAAGVKLEDVRKEPSRGQAIEHMLKGSRVLTERLLKEGRKYGVCCIFATQNPKDFDVRGLSNCNTWMVSKLATDADRGRINPFQKGVQDRDGNLLTAA